MVAALVCASSLLLVTKNINQARLALQESKEGAFNYILQADRSFDRLHWKINEYLATDSATHKKQLWPELQLRFDVIWSTFRVFDIHVPAEERLNSADLFSENVEIFLSTNDDLFISKLTPKDSELESVQRSITLLSTELFGVGVDVFARFNIFRDSISHRMEKLYRYFWISGLLLMLTATALITQLFRIANQSARLYDQAQKSELRLVTIVEELRNGRREQKAKDSFLAAASHDLRQPLHALGLFANALEDKVVLPDGPIILDKIQQSTAALSGLLSSLLDLSRLDAGVVHAQPQHFYCSDLFRSLKQEFEEMAMDRNINFRMEAADEVVHTDYNLLARILRNIIDNSMKFTRLGEVVVSCFDRGNAVIVSITDTGIGIPVEEQESIFSEYHQLGNPERDRSKGLGLGLSIVRRLSDLLGIEVTIVSDVDIGTKIELKVPSGEAVMQDLNTASELVVAERDFQGALILVIDDEQHVREGMELILDKANCTVLSAESGESATQLVVEESLSPVLIIVDYRLRNGKTGIEAVEMLRDELKENIPAVVVTGDTSPERVKEVTESGMRLLHKPVHPDILFEAMDTFLEFNTRH